MFKVTLVHIDSQKYVETLSKGRMRMMMGVVGSGGEGGKKGRGRRRMKKRRRHKRKQLKAYCTFTNCHYGKTSSMYRKFKA